MKLQSGTHPLQGLLQVFDERPLSSLIVPTLDQDLAMHAKLLKFPEARLARVLCINPRGCLSLPLSSPALNGNVVLRQITIGAVPLRKPGNPTFVLTRHAVYTKKKDSFSLT